MSVPTVFLSASSKDLEDWRNLLHATFENAGCKVLTQKISLGAATSDVLDLLKSNLDRSDYVLHIAGTAYGSEPTIPPFPSHPDFICSFTQFEYYYSRQTIDHKVIAFVCAESFPFKKFSEEGKDNKERERKKLLQQQHRLRLLNGNFDGTPVEGQPLSHPVEDVNSLLKEVAGAIGRIRSDAPTSLEKVKETLLGLAEKQHQELLELSRKRHNELKDLLERNYLEVKNAANEFRKSSRELVRQRVFGAAISILVIVLLCAVLLVLKPIQRFVVNDREEVTSIENDFQRSKQRIQEVYGERKQLLLSSKLDPLLRQDLLERIAVEQKEAIRALERQTQLMQGKPVNDPLSLYSSLLEISAGNISEQEKVKRNRALIDQTRPKRLELAKKDGMALLWPEHAAALGAFIRDDIEGANKYFRIFVDAQEDYPEALLDACFFYLCYYERNRIAGSDNPLRIAYESYICAKRIENHDFEVSASARFANEVVPLAYLCMAREELEAGNIVAATDLIESARPKLKSAISTADDRFTATVRYFGSTEILVRAAFEALHQEEAPPQSLSSLLNLIQEELKLGNLLVEEFEMEVESYRLLSQAYENLGNYLRTFSARESNDGSALEYYQKSLDTLKKVPALYASDFLVQCDIAQVYLTIGHFYMDHAYDLVRAQSAFDEAEKIMSKQVAEEPDSAFAKKQLAFALGQSLDVRFLLMYQQVGNDVRVSRSNVSLDTISDLRDIAQRAVKQTRDLFVDSVDFSDFMQYEHAVSQLLTTLWLSNDSDGYDTAVDSFRSSLIELKIQGKLSPHEVDAYLQKIPRTMDDFENSGAGE